MPLLTFDYYYSSGFHTVYTVNGEVTKAEEYREYPVDNFSAFWSDRKGTDVSTWDVHLRLKSRYTQGQRLACYMQENTVSGNTSYTFLTYNANVFDFSGLFTNENGSTSTKSYANLPYEYWSNPDAMSCPIMCNLPVFDNQTHAEAYMNAQTDTEALSILEQYALNYSTGATVPETKEYFYYGRANEITVNQYGEISSTGSPQLIKGFRVKSTGRVSLYAVEGIDDGALKLMINLHDVEIAYYSYDLETWQNQQGSPTTLPFSFVWRGWDNEVGTFYCSGTRSNPSFETNCPIFLNKQDSDDYNDTGEGGENAINWNEISNNAPVFNPTGLDDEAKIGRASCRERV